ncbi:hypothetical protein PTT_01099, partial [Pyrenophora teres f. teres 0-1]
GDGEHEVKRGSLTTQRKATQMSCMLDRARSRILVAPELLFRERGGDYCRAWLWCRLVSLYYCSGQQGKQVLLSL